MQTFSLTPPLTITTRGITLHAVVGVVGCGLLYANKIIWIQIKYYL